MKRFFSLLLIVLLLVPAGSALAVQDAPTGPVTRGEFVAALNGAFGLFDTGIGALTDVAADSPYYYDMLAALRAGYLRGYADGSGRPEAPVTRLETAVMIDRLATLPEARGVDITDAVPEWGLASARRAVSAGVLQLDENGAFRPGDPLSQSEEAQVLAALQPLLPTPLWTEEMLEIPTYDGHSFQGRLTLPAGQQTVDKVVLYINGTGVNTYLNRRENGPYRFHYFDYFADRFAKQGTAFFSYNTRGVDVSDTAPYYTVDWDVYGTYSPQNIAKDVASMVEELKKQPALKDAEIYLLGWSEGAIVAPLAVVQEGVEADGLLLAGYPNDNMADILKWQLDGPQTFFLYTIYFDAEGQVGITHEQYEADPYGAMETMFGGVSFADTDVNGNGLIDVGDFSGNQRAQMHQLLLDAVERGDDGWIQENFMELPAYWFSEHFRLGSTEDILAQVTDIPIHIFHGTYDLNCPVQGVYDVQKRFADMGRTNLNVHIFKGHNHDLNYDLWLLTNIDSTGCLAIFDTVASLGK